MGNRLMTLEEIENHFGPTIATECRKMKNEEIRDFYDSPYEAISVQRKDDRFGTVYSVSGENTIQEALTVDEEEMYMDFW